MDLKAVMRLLRLSYGILGQERRKLLQPFVDSTRLNTMSPERLSEAISHSGSNTSRIAPKTAMLPVQPVTTTTATTTTTTTAATTPPRVHISTSHVANALSQTTERPKPLHFGYQRSIPPIISAPLASLIRNATGKSVEPTLPEPLYKPLHGKREANLRWRSLMKQIGKVTPPLPSEIRQEIEWKSRVGLHGADREDAASNAEYPANWEEWEQGITKTIKAWNRKGTVSKELRWEGGNFHPSIGGKPARPNTLTPRLYRRIWQHLLDDFPVLDVQSAESNSGLVSGKESASMESLSSAPATVPLKMGFSVSKSALSYESRLTTSLKHHAKLNTFDQIGISEDTSAPTVKGGRKGSKGHS